MIPESSRNEELEPLRPCSWESALTLCSLFPVVRKEGKERGDRVVFEILCRAWAIEVVLGLGG